MRGACSRHGGTRACEDKSLGSRMRLQKLEQVVQHQGVGRPGERIREVTCQLLRGLFLLGEHLLRDANACVERGLHARGEGSPEASG